MLVCVCLCERVRARPCAHVHRFTNTCLDEAATALWSKIERGGGERAKKRTGGGGEKRAGM